MLFTNERLGNFAKDPAIIRYKGEYFMYYTIKYCSCNFKIGIGIARSSNMESWIDCGEMPLTLECEKNGIGAPAAIVFGNVVHIFYQTYGNWKNDAICHATSTDGITFEKDPSNPIFHPTNDWCCGRAIDADVCLFKDRIFLYFATRDHNMKIQKIGCAWADPSSNMSRSSWHQTIPQSILTPEMAWEGECIEAPATIVNDGRLFMFYGGSYNCTPQQIGCAYSDDVIFFQRAFTTPFMTNGAPGSWNSCESGHPYVFRDYDGRVYLFYQGSPDMGQTWYLSRTEIAFDKNNMPFILSDVSKQ